MADINLIVQATDKATPVLKRVNKQVDKFSRKSKKATRSGMAMGKMMKFAGAAVLAATLMKVASGLVRTITSFESLRASLKTVTGSVDGMRVAMHQIEQFTKTTPFQLEEVANSFIILQRMGIDTTTESLKAFGNIAAANSKSFEQLAEAVADAMTGEFERLKEFGIKVRRENDKMVVSMGDTEMGIADSASGVVDILKALGEEGGAYAEGLNDQLKTLGGKWSNLGDNISSFADKVGTGGLSTALKDALDDVNGLFEGTSGLANMLGAGLGAAIYTALNFLQRLWGFFRSLGNFFKEEIKLWIKWLSVPFTWMANRAKAALEKLQEHFGITFEEIPAEVNKMINKVVNFFRYLVFQAAEIINQLPNLFRWTVQNIKEIIKGIPGAFKRVFLGIGDMAVDFATRLVNKFVNIGSAIKEAILAPFTDGTVAGAYATLKEKVFEGFNDAWDWTQGDLGDWIPSDVMLTDERIAEIFNQKGLEEIWNWYKSELPGVADALVGVAEATKNLFINEDLSFIETYRLMIAEGVKEQLALELALLKAGKQQQANTKTTKDAIPVVDKLKEAYEKLVKQLHDGTEQDLLRIDLLEKVNEGYADGTLNLEEYSEALKQIQSDYAPLEVQALRTIDAIKSGFQGMAGSITNTFYDMFAGVTSVFDGLRSIASMVFQMIAKAIIQTMIVQPLINALTGGIGGWLGALFGGKAQGGLAAGGQPTLVGEEGPELVVPSGNTRVYSNTETERMLGDTGRDEPLTVNFNLNAVSTQDGIEFLLNNKDTITTVIQDAYHNRGRAGPLS